METSPSPGRPFPLGATPQSDGVNFSIYSKSASRIELLLFDGPDDPSPARSIMLHRHSPFHTFHYWHVFVPDLQSGQIYGYRAHAPQLPSPGDRFDARQVLLDPYGRLVSMPDSYSRRQCGSTDGSCAKAMKSVVVDLSTYDWSGDVTVETPLSGSIIYELHVGGFTRHPTSGLEMSKRGTFSGVIEKIPYLQSLGVTTVELMPVFQFDPQEAPEGLTNYWGYNPVSFFSPHHGYAVPGQDPAAVLDEFRDMVKAFHQAGMQVILDVVYNHTAEGNEWGPTLSLKGLENRTYYLCDPETGAYHDYSGTGNTLNANHSVVRRLILDSLRYWVTEMHVDGFRFDLASILSRDSNGQPLPVPPVLWDIESDPCLAGKKLIAEAWDAAGLYQVGSFFGERWREWNGQFRDDFRCFLKGDSGFAGKIASRFLASPDLYGDQSRDPEHSVNFVTCHDGFTLNDLVSYNEKNNQSNGESNRDGTNVNFSWNCGAEGLEVSDAIETLRLRQIKNALVVNLLALGVPMLLMGDEVRRTQHGNNNAYCQDNETSWFDWSLVEKNSGLLDFVRKLIRFRLDLPVREENAITLSELLHQTKIDWHGTRLFEPDWSRDSHVLCFTLHGQKNLFHFIYNAYWQSLEFELPSKNGIGTRSWKKMIDTSVESPHDFCDLESACLIRDATQRVPDRTIVVLTCSVE